MGHIKSISRLPQVASIDTALSKYADALANLIDQKANALGS